jgi:hypothetical protein
MPKSGLAIHCHHDKLFEYCYNYDEKVNYIKSDKPKHEIETRLQLFKMLSREAIAELPKRLVKAYADWKKADAEYTKANAEYNKARVKADADWEKAYADWKKAYADWKKAYADWKKADAEYTKADAEYTKADQEAWHKKWCGCKEWNGKEIVFEK